jgi:hypothetical protein
MLFSGKEWETSSLGRAPRPSVILAQVGVDNVLIAMKNIHRWGFAFIPGLSRQYCF